MSRTTTMSEAPPVPSSKIAPFVTSSTVWLYPFVRNSKACMFRDESDGDGWSIKEVSLHVGM